MKDPAFLFYPNDWMGGTMYMTFEQKGCYMELLILQFNIGAFTEAQAKQVLSICFDVAWPMLKLKFKNEGDLFYNERLKFEIEKRKKFTESRRNNALQPKKEVKKDITCAEHMHKHMENENRNRNINKKESKKEIVIPSYEEFEKYALSKKINLDKQHLRLKFDSWIEADWTDGNGNKIKNWKSKLLNTIPFLKESFQQVITKPIEEHYINSGLKEEYRPKPIYHESNI